MKAYQYSYIFNNPKDSQIKSVGNTLIQSEDEHYSQYNKSLEYY